MSSHPQIPPKFEDIVERHMSGDVDGAIIGYRRDRRSRSRTRKCLALAGGRGPSKGSACAGLRSDRRRDRGSKTMSRIITAISGGCWYLSTALRRQRQLSVQAVSLDGTHAKARGNLAGVLRQSGSFVEAAAQATEAARLAPDDPEALNNLGNALKDVGRVDDAVAAYDAAIEAAPDYALAHWNRSLAQLLAGDLRAGFDEMAWRWKWQGFPGRRRDFDADLWDGSPLDGKTILIHAEQGLGDAIQFARYGALVMALAKETGATTDGKVVMECPGALVPLVQDQGLADEVIAAGTLLPLFDMHAPFLDLPQILGTDLGSVPNTVPYLSAGAGAIDTWRERIDGAGLKVGINWCGNSDSPVERFRQLPLADFAAMFQMPGVAWYSLQKGPGVVRINRRLTNLVSSIPAKGRWRKPRR